MTAPAPTPPSARQPVLADVRGMVTSRADWMLGAAPLPKASAHSQSTSSSGFHRTYTWAGAHTEELREHGEWEGVGETGRGGEGEEDVSSRRDVTSPSARMLIGEGVGEEGGAGKGLEEGEVGNGVREGGRAKGAGEGGGAGVGGSGGRNCSVSSRLQQRVDQVGSMAVPPWAGRDGGNRAREGKVVTNLVISEEGVLLEVEEEEEEDDDDDEEEEAEENAYLAAGAALLCSAAAALEEEDSEEEDSEEEEGSEAEEGSAEEEDEGEDFIKDGSKRPKERRWTCSFCPRSFFCQRGLSIHHARDQVRRLYPLER